MPLNVYSVYLLVVLAFTGSAFAADSTAGTRHVRYGIVVENTRSTPLENAAVWVYAPLSDSPFQTAETLSTSYPHEEMTDTEGNRILRFELKDLPPLGSRVITIDAGILMRDEPLSSAPPHARDLAETPLISFRSDSFQAHAPLMITGNDHASAEKLFDWVRGHLVQSTYVKRPLGSEVAITGRRGDCTEFSTLFTSLCRMNGIPARVCGGYVVKQSGVLPPTGYHEWVEYYAGGTWHLADPQQGLFNEHASTYLVLRRGLSSDGPMQE